MGLMMIHWEIVASSGKQAGVSYGPHLGTMEFLGAHVSWVRGASRLEQSGPQSVAWLRCGLRGASRAVQSCTTARPARLRAGPHHQKRGNVLKLVIKARLGEPSHFSVLASGGGGNSSGAVCLEFTLASACACAGYFLPARTSCTSFACRRRRRSRNLRRGLYDAVAYLRQRRPVRQFASLGRSRPSSRPEASS